MSSDAELRLTLRTAFEALRAGVPNRAAVRLLGSVEDGIEDRFEAGLGSVWDAPAPGVLFAGGFGAGKSHLLGFLRESALKRNFVVSTVSVSKATPLSSPAAVFAAAMRQTLVPGHTDDVMTVALAAIQRRAGAVQELELFASAELAPIFAAILHVLNRRIDPDLLRQIEAFLAGGKAPGKMLNQALRQGGARGIFNVSGTNEALLAAQRERLTPRLLRAAGFAGWCVLIDEVELIGRYPPLQRARAYAELGRWLGLGTHAAGVQVAAAITDDFAAALIHGRQDDEKLPERLRSKGFAAEAALALAAMRAIEAAPLLRGPAEADLHRHGEVLRQAYGAAYDFAAPALPVAARRADRTMRQHIRGWITQWDVLRLQGRTAALELGTIAPNYTESEDLGEDGTVE